MARRAALLGSTLASIGCAPTAPPPDDATVVVPSANATADEPAEGPTGGPTAAVGPRATYVLPSAEIPAGVGPEAQRRFEALFRNAKALHAILDELDQLVPSGCSIAEPRCEARWKGAAAKMSELQFAQQGGHFCPGSSADAKLFAAREAEHKQVLAARMQAIEQRIAQGEELAGPPGKGRWTELVRQAYEAKPYPCLTMSCQDW